MSRVENASRNLIWGIVNKFIGILMPFLTRTVMIYTLGILYLGLNGLFSSILQVLNISELGISSAIVFSMYKPIAEHKDEEVCALLNFYRRCYRIVGLVVLLIGLMLLPFLPQLIEGEIPSDINIYILYLLYLAGTVLSYELFAYRTSLLEACQRNDIVSIVQSICKIGQFLCQMTVLIIFKNYYCYVLLIVFNNILNNLVNAGICRKKYPQYQCVGKVDKETLKGIVKRVEGMFFQKIGNTVLNSADPIVISTFLGLSVLGVYQNYVYVVSALMGIMSAIYCSLISVVGNSVATESVEKNYRDFKYINFIYVWIVSWFSICLLCLFQPFMKIWVGEGYMLSDKIIVLFTLYFFTWKWCDTITIYQEACGEWWAGRWVAVSAAIVNVVSNIILVNIIGLAGVLLSTIISIILIHDIGYSRVLFGRYFKNLCTSAKFLGRQFVYMLCACVACVFTYLICNCIKSENTVFVLVLRGIVCLVVPNVIMGLIWSRLKEYRDAKALIQKVIDKYLRKRK